MNRAAVNIAGLELRNPVMTASGTFGYGVEFSRFLNLERLGAVVVKGLSLQPREGNPGPRIIETPCGMLNAIGLQNVGVEAFIKEKLPLIGKYDVPVVANIFGETTEEYMGVAERLAEAGGVAAVEVNISCPNVKKGGMTFGTDPAAAAEVVEAVKRASGKMPVITKLSPNVTDITAMVRAAEDAGTDAVSLINTIPGMVVDVNSRRPVLARGVGGLSGPAIRPIAVRMVWEAARAAKVPVIGIGGITSAEDALQFMIAGASAVQVGTSSFVDPGSAEKVAVGIEKYLEENSTTAAELTGSLEFG